MTVIHKTLTTSLPDDREQEEMLAFLTRSHLFLQVRLLAGPGNWLRSLMDQDSLWSPAPPDLLCCHCLFLFFRSSTTSSV